MFQTFAAAVVAQSYEKFVVVVMPRAEQGVRLFDQIFPTGKRFRFIFERVGRIGGDVNFVRNAIFNGKRNFFEIFPDNRGRINKRRQRNFFEINRIA